jgi:hypothetical protein
MLQPMNRIAAAAKTLPRDLGLPGWPPSTEKLRVSAKTAAKQTSGFSGSRTHAPSATQHTAVSSASLKVNCKRLGGFRAMTVSQFGVLFY